MALHNRIDAGLSHTFDIHAGRGARNTPDVFVMHKRDAEQIFAMRSAKISVLVEKIAEGMAGIGFVNACGAWSVSEFEYNKILFMRLPETFKFFRNEQPHVYFDTVTFREAVDRVYEKTGIRPAPTLRCPECNSRLSRTADNMYYCPECSIPCNTKSKVRVDKMQFTLERNAQRKAVTGKKPAMSKQESVAARKRRKEMKDQIDLVVCKYCNEPIDASDKIGLEEGFHSHCFESQCECCGNEVSVCSCASRFSDSDDEVSVCPDCDTALNVEGKCPECNGLI